MPKTEIKKAKGFRKLMTPVSKWSAKTSPRTFMAWTMCIPNPLEGSSRNSTTIKCCWCSTQNEPWMTTPPTNQKHPTHDNKSQSVTPQPPRYPRSMREMSQTKTRKMFQLHRKDWAQTQPDPAMTQKKETADPNHTEGILEILNEE